MAGPLQVYDVTVGQVRTQMKLNEADAERLGGVPVASKIRGDVPDKARRPREPRSQPKAEVPTKTAMQAKAETVEDDRPGA